MKKLSLKLILANAVLLILALVCVIAWQVAGNLLESQKAAERWRGESDLNFEQFSVYLTEGGQLSLEDIYQFRQTLETKMTEAVLETPENGSLYSDAWSATGKLTVRGDHGSGEASVIAVGGDFFQFHPLTLVSGSYISESDVMKDRVILDEELAWMLFGGKDLEGMTVTINGSPFLVAGVVSREEDKASQKTYTGGAGMYMSYDAFNAISETGISCYEAVLPEPVDGFGENVLRENFRIGDGELVKNSSRFSFGSEWDILSSFGTRSMHTSSVAYPYWENAARYLEDWCALYLLLAMLFALVPVLSLCALLVLLLRRGKRVIAAKVPALAGKAVDKVEYRMFSRRSQKGSHVKRKER